MQVTLGSNIPLRSDSDSADPKEIRISGLTARVLNSEV
jgi:hypothetical protein